MKHLLKTPELTLWTNRRGLMSLACYSIFITPEFIDERVFSGFNYNTKAAEDAYYYY